ncbi:uncharacterized protein LOC110697266 [Chenopodium quinoa]|uniref:uncharacterized protein LOC110697266 n=1 Tax=Chenopodium quinoa TaxID=63459 RepID=UPI000B7843EE|nr:uncharacterized protein LOC110697266 [Chenopodium quinoa]
MASTQQVPSSVLSNKEIAAIEELMAKAKGKIASEGKVEAEEQSLTQGFLVNRTKNNVTLQKVGEYNWSGKPVTSYPEFIPVQDEEVRFEHQGPLPEGSVGGIVYADGTESTSRKWLVAFDTPKKKAYVEAGPAGPVDWNVIKVKLDASGYRSEYEDPVLGGKIYALNYGFALVAYFSN